MRVAAIFPGQLWKDRDKRSPFTVEITRITEDRVFYIRWRKEISTKREAFPKRFDFVHDPHGAVSFPESRPRSPEEPHK